MSVVLPWLIAGIRGSVLKFTAEMPKSGRVIPSLAFLLYCCAAVAQTPNVTGVLNSASGIGGLAPGVLAAILGTNLADNTCDLPSGTLAPLCGAQVTVNGRTAALVFASPTQLRAQVPVELAAGDVTLTVTRGSLRSTPFEVMLDSFAPGLFFRSGNIGAVSKRNGGDVTSQNPASVGERVILLADGLGPTNPPVATGAAPPGAVTATQPVVRVGGQPAMVDFSQLAPGFVGVYQVGFFVPDNLATGLYTLFLEIGGKMSNVVSLPVTSVRPPAINAVVNAASFAADAVTAPGSILSVFGVGFGPSDNLAAFPATDFAGLSVAFNNTRAPLFAVVASRNQINVLAPTELSETGLAFVQMTTTGGASEVFQLRLTAAAPGIFRIPDPSNPARKNAAALFANTAWRVVPDAMARALQIPGNCRGGGVSASSICGQPATAGDLLQVFVTGLGKATPGGDAGGRPLPTGAVAPADGNPLYFTVMTPSVTIADIPAQVLFSGLAPGFAGLYQINVRVPQGVPAGDDVAVKVSMPNGSSDTATMAIRR